MRTYVPTGLPRQLTMFAGLAMCAMAWACSAGSSLDSGSNNGFTKTIAGATGGANGEGAGGSSAAGGTSDTTSGAGGSQAGRVSVPVVSPPAATSDAGPDATCGSVDVDAHVDTIEKVVEIPGNVLFVFDQSTSMKDEWNGIAKWQAANDALVNGFSPLQDKLNAGVILFPSTATIGTITPGRGGSGITVGGGTCPVAPITSAPQMAIQPGATFLEKWKAYWKGGESVLQTGTPTEAGLLEAEAALSKPPEGNTVVVLLTDGQPNCGTNEAVVATRLQAKGIKTYVVGLPGASEGTRVLDAIAQAGGTAPSGCISNCFLTPTNSADLESVLSNIASTTVTTTTVPAIQDCSFTLHPADGADPADVHLIATDSADGKQYEVPQSSGSGWTLSEDHQTATLEGAVCEGAKTGKYAGFSFQYGCVTAPPLEVH